MDVRPEGGLQERVRRLAVEAGFATGGIAPLPRLDEQEAEAHARYFSEWVEQGHAGEMEYLKRRDALGRFVRSAVEVAVPWARSILVCAAPYGGGAAYPLSTDAAAPGAGWIGRYAWSGRETEGGGLAASDYHKVLLRRLKRVEVSLQQELGALQPGFQSWAYVDTGPMVERAFSAMAGIGWTGKNVCTLSEELGSFFFLGVIVTSLEVAGRPEGDAAGGPLWELHALPGCVPDRGADCAAADGCEPVYRLPHDRKTWADRGRAASRGGGGRSSAAISARMFALGTAGRGNQAPVVDSELKVRGELVNPSLAELAALPEAEWEGMFFGSPVKRSRFSGFRRNLAIAMGNSGDAALLPQLERWSRAEEPDAVLREMARWAVGRLMEKHHQEPE